MKDRIVSIAKGEVGVCEPLGDDKYIKHYNRVGKMNFLPDVPWCAIFVTWCKSMAEIDDDIIPAFASCDLGMKWFKDRNLWQNGKGYGGDYNPKKGDIIFFSSKYNPNDSTHVGIVTNLSGNSVLTVEGNSYNRVRECSYLITSKYILGYGTPKYVAYEDIYDSYVVKEGDNLWKISREKLGSGSRFLEIMSLNDLTGPLIHPGQLLLIPNN